MSAEYGVFLGLDVGKSDHHAIGLAPDGKRLHDAPLPNTEVRLRALFDNLARHGRILVVVDQPASIGALYALVRDGVAPVRTTRARAGRCRGLSAATATLRSRVAVGSICAIIARSRAALDTAYAGAGYRRGPGTAALSPPWARTSQLNFCSPCLPADPGLQLIFMRPCTCHAALSWKMTSVTNLEKLLTDRLASAFETVAGERVDPVVRRSQHADFQGASVLVGCRQPVRCGNKRRGQRKADLARVVTRWHPTSSPA